MSSSPFLTSTHGHPNFNPVKIGKNLTAVDASKNSKQPKPPDKPLMPYMRYSKTVWEDVKARYPDLKIWEISRMIGQMWRELPEDEKQIYIDAFEVEKNQYSETLKHYHNSSAYQSWISSLKSKATKEHEERDTHKRKDKKSTLHALNSPQKGDGRVSLQSLDSEMEDEDDYFSMKHLAAARYSRNHCLVTEIFSDAIMPDPRSVVTHARLHTLQKQVESLTNHQNKLFAELRNIEDKFQEKKRSIIESSEKFNSEMYKRFTSKPVDEATYQKMYEKALEQIRKEHAHQFTTTAAAAAAVPQTPPTQANSAPPTPVKNNTPKTTTAPPAGVDAISKNSENNPNGGVVSENGTNNAAPLSSTITDAHSHHQHHPPPLTLPVPPSHHHPNQASTELTSSNTQDLHNLKENIPLPNNGQSGE